MIRECQLTMYISSLCKHGRSTLIHLFFVGRKRSYKAERAKEKYRYDHHAFKEVKGLFPAMQLWLLISCNFDPNCVVRATVNTRQDFWHILDKFDVWQVANRSGENLVTRQRNDKLISWEAECVFWVNGMVAYQVKVKYREERFCTFLIKDITFAKLMQEMKHNCLPLAHLPSSNIRVR